MVLSNHIAQGVYAAFLLVILIINLLYFFQVFRFRLPGDVSIIVLVIHSAILLSILVASSIYLGFS